MSNREEFEKWAVVENYDVKKSHAGNFESLATQMAEQGWNSRQPEIDALTLAAGNALNLLIALRAEIEFNKKEHAIIESLSRSMIKTEAE